MRVKSIADIIESLHAQGSTIISPHELKPRYLGREGYVGCPVTLRGKDQVVWIVSVDVVNLGGGQPKAFSAEWLTLELVRAGGQIGVADLMARYLDAFPPGGSAQRSGTEPPGIESLSMLAYIADFMGFIDDPMTDTVRMPDDHPMYEQALANRKEHR